MKLSHDTQAYNSSDPTEELNVIAISDNDPTRSPSPNSAIQLKPKFDGYDGPSLNLNGSTQTITPAVSRFAPSLNRSDSSNPQRLILKTRIDSFPQSSSPAPPGSGHPTFRSNGYSSRRPRPETSHQKAVNINRKMRIDHILHNEIQFCHRVARKKRSAERSSFGLMVMNRVRDLPDLYDTDDDNSWGPGGLLPDLHEFEDFGEEAISYKKAIDRAVRRLYREENGGSLDSLVKGYRKRKRKSRMYPEGIDPDGRSRKRRKDDISHSVGIDGFPDARRREEALDDLDLALLGEGQDEEDEMDEDMDDSDEGDVTEDEVLNEA